VIKKAILLFIVLSQQCCEIYFISLIVAKPLSFATIREMKYISQHCLTTKYYWNRHP